MGILIMRKMNKRYDAERLGIIIGMIVPLLVIVGFYVYRRPESISSFFENMISVGIFSELVSLCVVPNLLLFFVFIWTNRLKSARCVIGATFIYTLIVLGMKLFLQ